MTQHKSVWYVIADGGRARILVPSAGGSGYTTIDDIVSASAHMKSADLGSDKPGRSQESGTTARHAIAPKTDPHELEKEKFAKLLANQLNAAYAGGAFQALILVGPPRFLETLRGDLRPAVANAVVDELPKDLTGIPNNDLPSHLDKVGPPWAHTHSAT